MAYNLQDQEQIDELKAFWANNGNQLIDETFQLVQPGTPL